MRDMKDGNELLYIFGLFLLLYFLGIMLHGKLSETERNDKKPFKIIEKLFYSKCPVCKKHGVPGLKFKRRGATTTETCIHCRTELIVHQSGVMVAMLVAVPLILGGQKLLSQFTDNRSFIYCVIAVGAILCYYLCSYFAHVETFEDYYGPRYKKEENKDEGISYEEYYGRSSKKNKDNK